MRRFLFLLFAVLMLGPPGLFAQSSPSAKTFTLKAANQNACVPTAGLPTVNITLSGTANLTLTPQVSVNGGTASNSSVTSTVGGSQPQATIVVTTTITAATSGYSAPVGGSDNFCLNVSAYTSGSLTVVLNPSPALNASLLGGAAPVTSVFTRTGAVVANTGDYTCAQVTGCTTSGPVPISLVAGATGEFRMLASENPCALVDYSGSGNNATGCVATSPTIISGTGGVQFSGNGGITFPSALDTSKTIMLFLGYQSGSNANTWNSPIIGNGTFTPCGIGYVFTQSGNFGVTPAPPQQDGSYITDISGGSQFRTFQTFQGKGILTFTIPGTDDLFYQGAALPPTTAGGGLYQPGVDSSSFPFCSGGVWQMGGAASGTGFGVQTYYTGQIYYAVFYPTALTQAQIAQNVEVITNALAARGVTPLQGSTAAVNKIVYIGDSLTTGEGSGGITTYPANVTLNGTWNSYNLGETGSQVVANWVPTGGPLFALDMLAPSALWNLCPEWLGTNDIANGVSAAATAGGIRQLSQLMQSNGCKALPSTTISRTSNDTNIAILDTTLRQSFAGFSSGLIDYAADPELSPNGSNSTVTTVYQGDGIHLLQATQYNNVTPIAQRALNRQTGNLSWSTATTYTSGAPSGTATTNMTESSHTMTFTFSAKPTNCAAGNTMQVTGGTPSGYNSPASGWYILTSTATTLTAYNNTTGLGAQSGAATVTCPLDQDADVFSILGGSGITQNDTLEDCVGWTGGRLARMCANTTSPWTITPFNSSETIDGATSLTCPVATSGNYPVIILEDQLTSATAGGCTWARIQ